MGIIDQLYNYSPVCIQNIMCSAKGWLIKKRRYNKLFWEELKKYESYAYNPDEELKKFLLKICHLSAYSSIFNQSEVVCKLNEGCEIKDILSLFPIINKNYVKEHHNDFVNEKLNEAKIEMRTSGTTGSGLIFPYSVAMENKQWAIWWRYRRRLGVDLDTWCGWFGGRQMIPMSSKQKPFWRINKYGKQIMFSSFHLNNETVKSYCDEIIKRKMQWLHGYPSNISRLAALIIDNNLKPITSVSVVTTGAENIISNQIELIKRAFPNAIVRQHYGLNEGVANISQNKDGIWEVDDDFCYVEFIPVSKDNPEICRIIGTGFSNLAFPLVRYDTGDLAHIKYNNGKIEIISIDGRSSNVIKLPSGQDICEASLSIFLHDYNNVVEAQFYQQAIDDVELRIVKGNYYDDNDEKSIYLNAKQWFPSDVHFHINYVENIERTKAGKLKLVITDLK